MELLNSLNLDKDLLLDFFIVFSRFEYSLKRAGFLKSNDGSAEPNHDKFGSTYKNQFQDLIAGSEEFTVAVNYFFDTPPKRQWVNDGKLDWKNQDQSQLARNLNNLLVLVRTVRNNLFHGGKYPSGPVDNPERNEKLLKNSLVVMKTCLDLDSNVKTFFEDYKNEDVN